jgi:hypothetical protein
MDAAAGAEVGVADAPSIPAPPWRRAKKPARRERLRQGREIALPQAAMNATVAALAGFSVRHLDTPLTSESV